MGWILEGVRQPGAWAGILSAKLDRAWVSSRSGADQVAEGVSEDRARAMACRWERESAEKALGGHLARDVGLAEPSHTVLPPIIRLGERGGK